MEENISNIDLQNISMQNLAFIGDAVYNVYIRTYLVAKANENTGKVHFKSINYVSAKAQSYIIDNISEKLDENEILIYKRGRNTNINNVSKNVDVVSYKKATGFEALIGYLYLIKNTTRLDEIVNLSIQVVEGKTNEK